MAQLSLPPLLPHFLNTSLYARHLETRSLYPAESAGACSLSAGSAGNGPCFRAGSFGMVVAL